MDAFEHYSPTIPPILFRWLTCPECDRWLVARDDEWHYCPSCGVAF